jgi:hypothetical protein
LVVVQAWDQVDRPVGRIGCTDPERIVVGTVVAAVHTGCVVVGIVDRIEMDTVESIDLIGRSLVEMFRVIVRSLRRS